MHYRRLIAISSVSLLLLAGAVGTGQTASERNIQLLALGDWGIASPDRRVVAQAMAKFAAEPGRRPDAVLLLGDNFYVKLSGITDPQIQDFFEKTYDPTKLNVPFYAVMGNHDYKNNDVGIEMDYARSRDTRLKIPARWYRLDLPVEKPLITVLMLDSDAAPDLMSQQDWQAENKWLAAELQKPHAPWLICCAHHDIFGNGNHGDNGVLMTTWGPMLMHAHVDFYVCGHEHTLQHLEIPNWPISFVVAGGGGAGNKPMLRDNRGPFSRSTHGFASFRFTPDLATVQLIGDDGATVHEFTRTREGKISITLNSPSDPATKHKLKAINGIDDK